MVRAAFAPFACVAILLSISGCSGKTSLGGGGGSCEAPAGLETLAANQDPTSVAVDGTSVYWTVLPPNQQQQGGSQEGAILKAPLGGGAVTTLESVNAYDFGPVLVDDTSIYWFDTPSASAGLEVQITKADKTDGGNPTVLASSASVMGLAVDSTSVYWSAESAVMKVDKMGGSPVTLATEQSEIFGPALDSTNAYYTRGGSATINGVSQGPDGAVVSVPLAGGTPHTLVSMHGVTPNAVAVQGRYVYYTTMAYPPGPSRTGALMRVPVGGGAATTLASESDMIRALAVDSSNVYWGGFDLGLKIMPLSGGTPAEPAPCQFPTGIAANDTTLFWVDSHGANQGDGTVMRLTPK